MSDCCSSTCSSKNLTRKYQCPENNKEGSRVTANTILYHIKEPWKWSDNNQNYYFCNDPECAVVYFSDDNLVIRKSELRTKVGIKEKTPDSQICYCFEVTLDDFKKNPEIKSFVIQQTKDKNCACETHNPSGKCCLKDFPK